jgi:FkbM family methyltransferase
MFTFMKDFIRPGMVIVEVGANIGTHSIYSARLTGESGKVIAIEADPETAAILRENVALNDCENVVVFEGCIADKTGIGPFNVHSNSAKSSIVYAGVSRTSIPTHRLQDVLAKELQIDLLKIDVEGADYLVLLGACEIFRRRPRGLSL